MRLSVQKLEEIHPSPAELEAHRYLTVREAAKLLDVSTRSMYGYIASGRMPAYRMGHSFVIEAETVRQYQRQSVGRPRERIPVWHIPPVFNAQSVTTIFVAFRSEQQEQFARKMREIREEGKHALPGTAARYISLSQSNPGVVQIVLVWRQSFLPAEEVLQAALVEMRADLADVLDWETAVIYESQVVLSA